jgi:hypothetical protein
MKTTETKVIILDEKGNRSKTGKAGTKAALAASSEVPRARVCGACVCMCAVFVRAYVAVH